MILILSYFYNVITPIIAKHDDSLVLQNESTAKTWRKSLIMHDHWGLACKLWQMISRQPVVISLNFMILLIYKLVSYQRCWMKVVSCCVQLNINNHICQFQLLLTDIFQECKHNLLEMLLNLTICEKSVTLKSSGICWFWCGSRSVSYTHLTLPTILRV